MKPEDLQNAIGDLDEMVVADAAASRRVRKNRLVRVVACAAAVCLLVTGTAVWLGGRAPTKKNNPLTTRSTTPAHLTLTDNYTEKLSLAMEPVFPEQVVCPNAGDYEGGEANEEFQKAYDRWFDANRARQQQSVDRSNDMTAFYRATVPALLGDSGADNRVYSPLSLNLALSMLAETTGGQTRKQILDLLAMDGIDSVRRRVSMLWDTVYRADGVADCRMASALWMSDKYTFRKNVLQTLADKHFAASFAGKVGTTDFDSAMQSWLNAQTGGMLEQQVGGLRTDSKTAMMMLSTLYFKARWQDTFDKSRTKDGTFYAPDGEKTASFMYADGLDNVYDGGDFLAVERPFMAGGSMWLMLPDKGKSVDDILDSEAFYNCGKPYFERKWESTKYTMLHLTMPKFDVASDLDLTESLKSLGLTDAFDALKADFSPLCDDPLVLGSARQAARVTADEDGVTAAAYTALELCGNAMPDGETDFVLDRPFVFAIQSQTGVMLFAGVVNQPAN